MKTCPCCGRAFREKNAPKIRRPGVKSGCPNPGPRIWKYGEKPAKHSYSGACCGTEVIVADPLEWRERLEGILARPDIAPGGFGISQGFTATAHERALALVEFLSVYEMEAVGGNANSR